MKNIFILSAQHLLLILVFAVQVFNVKSQSFTCDSDLYQVVDGNTLKLLVPATGIYQTVGTSSINYNGAGFNSEDDYIYGIGSGNVLLRVDITGEGTSLGSISGFSALSYSGDFDTEGNWYSFRRVSGNWIMNVIDVSVLPPVAQEFSITELSGVKSASNANDISYNPVTQKFYGMSGGTLMEFDHVNKTVMSIADYAASADSGGYGAVWSDSEGNTYFFNNGTGNIYRAQFTANGDINSFSFISTSSPNGNNDGMSCSLAAPPVFPEVCDNGIDDDGDGLIDCEDPDCTSTETCGVSGVIYNSSFACTESIATYHAFYTNNSTLSNTIVATETLPDGFIFLQDTLEFDAGGYSDFVQQPIEGDEGVISWGTITLEGGETVRISYDVTFDETVSEGTLSNNMTASLGEAGTQAYPSVISSDIQIGECPEPNQFDCTPAFYQVYKKKGKNQPNVYGRLEPITGDYDMIAIASDYANGLGYDINTGLVYGASGKKFIELDEDGLVIDKGITFNHKVYRGDINENSEWYGVDGSDVVKIDVSGTPFVEATYSGQGLPGWDIAYNSDGNFYSIHNQTLYQFNTSTNQKVTLGSVSGFNLPTSGGYGAQWTGADGYLYASHNKTGKIIRVDVSSREARVVSSSIDGLSKNDGFSCPLEIPAVYQFDYGDNSRLPQCRVLSYYQDLSQDGIPDYSTLWIGNTVDYDFSGESNQEATGDMDDGFSLSTEIQDDSLSWVLGLNTNFEGTAYYLIGFDWDDDGAFDEIINRSLVLNSAQTILDQVATPSGFEGGFVNCRAVITEEPLVDSQISGDILSMGEVEDYRYEITMPCTGDDCEVSTGENGGLESNGSLSEALAMRSFSRSKSGDQVHSIRSQMRLSAFKNLRTSGLNGLDDYLPDTGLNGSEVVTVSTPQDLVDLTNASQVFATDYYRSGSRVAAALILETQDEVYNHSKNVCDRLNGKSIEDVQTMNLDGISVIYAKIKDSEGVIEYSAWFSVNTSQEPYKVLSYWNIDKYPEGSYLNFQAWSSSPAQVFHILKHAISQLRSKHKIVTQTGLQQVPSVFVKSGEYDHGYLKMLLANPSHVTESEVNVSYRVTENSDFQNDLVELSLTGEEEEEVTIPVGYIFDAGLSLWAEQEQAYDALYLADGAWGIDYNPLLSRIDAFTISEVEKDPTPDTYLIERSFKIEGQSDHVINVFRNVKAGERTLNFDGYSTLSFEMKSDHPIEIVLIESKLMDWENRLKYTVNASDVKRKYTLSLDRFVGANQGQELDVRSVIFSYLNQSGEPESFEFEVSDLTLGNEVVQNVEKNLNMDDPIRIIPNPVMEAGIVQFVSNLSGEYKITISDLSGRIARVSTGSATTGANEVVIDHPSNGGIYIVTVETPDSKKKMVKVVFQ